MTGVLPVGFASKFVLVDILTGAGIAGGTALGATAIPLFGPRPLAICPGAAKDLLPERSPRIMPVRLMALFSKPVQKSVVT
jgi:hypothetical protein